jgi:hypothetical protein
MPNSQSILSYPDVKDLLDKAITGKRLVVHLRDEKAAHRLMSRCNSFRLLDRKENARLYEESHMMHGRSLYDPLIVTRDGANVQIYKLDLGMYEVEEV